MPREYALAALSACASTAVCWTFSGALTLPDMVMVYLAGTAAVAMRGRRAPALLAAAAAVACFDFFFVPPRFTFHVEHPQYLVTFAVMFGAALLISHLAVRARRDAEAAKAAELVAETERLRSSLLSAVSHELRTPLAAIIGSASTLLRDAPGSDLLANIRDEAERMTRLVHNLLETTRLESGARLKKELYSIEELVGTALARLEKPLSGRAVETDIPENLPLVPLDPELMELVLVNLIENAARHAPDAAITVSARERRDAVEVSVSDRGPGLAEGEHGRVFEKFYRAGGAAPGGAGLGLAICKAVVEAHGGVIRAESRPAGGATFLFTVPREASA